MQEYAQIWLGADAQHEEGLRLTFHVLFGRASKTGIFFLKIWESFCILQTRQQKNKGKSFLPVSLVRIVILFCLEAQITDFLKIPNGQMMVKM